MLHPIGASPYDLSWWTCDPPVPGSAFRTGQHAAEDIFALQQTSALTFGAVRLFCLYNGKVFWIDQVGHIPFIAEDIVNASPRSLLRTGWGGDTPLMEHVRDLPQAVSIQVTSKNLPNNFRFLRMNSRLSALVYMQTVWAVMSWHGWCTSSPNMRIFMFDFFILLKLNYFIFERLILALMGRVFAQIEAPSLCIIPQIGV